MFENFIIKANTLSILSFNLYVDLSANYVVKLYFKYHKTTSKHFFLKRGVICCESRLKIEPISDVINKKQYMLPIVINKVTVNTYVTEIILNFIIAMAASTCYKK